MRKGIALVWVILMILLALILPLVSIASYAHRSSAEYKLKKLKKKLLEIKGKKIELIEIAQEASIPSGFEFKEEAPQEELLDFKQKEIKRLEMLYGKRPSRRYKTLQEILSDLIIYINSLDLRLKDKESLLRIYREKRRFQERLAKQKLQERRSAELSEQRRLEELEKIAQDEKKKFEEFMQKKDQEINKLLEAIQTQHKLYDPAIKGSEIYRREKEIERLRFQIEEAIVRETIEHDIMHPHGKIVRNDPANMIAFIDIGKTKRVQPGMIFLIGKRGKKWKLTYKAKIVVKKVMKNFSQVRILKLYDPTIPVVEGDKIYNPFFSPKRPLVVVFAGKDDPELRYTLEEAKGRIIELGSIVREEVDLQTDFVVVASGADEDPNYIKAQQLSIPLVKAKEIFKFLGE